MKPLQEMFLIQLLASTSYSISDIQHRLTVYRLSRQELPIDYTFMSPADSWVIYYLKKLYLQKRKNTKITVLYMTHSLRSNL